MSQGTQKKRPNQTPLTTLSVRQAKGQASISVPHETGDTRWRLRSAVWVGKFIPHLPLVIASEARTSWEVEHMCEYFASLPLHRFASRFPLYWGKKTFRSLFTLIRAKRRKVIFRGGIKLSTATPDFNVSVG